MNRYVVKCDKKPSLNKISSERLFAGFPNILFITLHNDPVRRMAKEQHREPGRQKSRACLRADGSAVFLDCLIRKK
jgi:hypothetical protein